jgi:acyl-CoA dehydrogenase
MEVGMAQAERSIRSPDPESRNYFTADANLLRLLERITPDLLGRYRDELASFGEWAANAVDGQAAYTDRYAPPVLETYDRAGRVVNRIVYNPCYEAVYREVYERGILGRSYGEDAAPHLLGFAMGYLLCQADISIHCPVTLTGAVAYVLDRFAPDEVREAYLPDLVRTDGWAKTGGTWATELHGGSDVGATTTIARESEGHFELTGLKWFASNANSGLALATARPEGSPEGWRGLGVYLVPSHLEGGEPNRYRVRRLKEKLGTRGLATGEVELDGAYAVEVAPPPEGFRLMMEALEYSRVHNAVGSAGIQRRAFAEALEYAERREAFGERLTSFPMVRDELLGMLAQLEADVALAFESARAFDAALEDEAAKVWLRVSTALAKYRTAENAVKSARRALELLGGNGYTAEYATERLVRDAQVTTVWEGPANIQALELLRMVGGRYPGFESFERRVRAVQERMSGLGSLREPLDRALAECREAVGYLRAYPAEGPRYARKLMDLMADTLAFALLCEEAVEDHAAGDGRKALVARLLLEESLRPPRLRGIGPEGGWAQRHFRELVGYEPVEAGGLA